MNDNLTPLRKPDDIDAALRPKSLAEFIGQEALRANLAVFVAAAKSSGSPRLLTTLKTSASVRTGESAGRS